MTVWSLTECDIDCIALGAGILGTGGGGAVHLVQLRAKAALRAGKEIRVISPRDLTSDDWVLPLSALGAPTVWHEKPFAGSEAGEVITALERFTGRTVTALMSDEVGGANGLEHMVVAADMGLPVVDCDGMGRAFPEVPMTTLYINGLDLFPAAQADDKGNVVLYPKGASVDWLETFCRSNAISMGGMSMFGFGPFNGLDIGRTAIHHTISHAWRIGHEVLSARANNTDPVAALLRSESATALITGKITALDRETVDGFSRGKMEITEVGGARTVSIDIQNEYLIARDGHTVLCVVPDLICLLDSETAAPVACEELRFGLRVTTLAIACSDALRSEKALKVVGPQAFGYGDTKYNPFGKYVPPEFHGDTK
ncbi:DUF917 domain-containing protein [Ruegeria sp. EL01]|jgi:hypothetical protein|uniref:DUF917 domain-containing protein n=1 Tax=Ruegeria sp. EL01 TaxID=2107578 RepID=UPI000EA82191|nr:DUF917 domain-containing protein [Ruegeria sp. EL01]